MTNLQIYRRIEDEVTPEIIKDPLLEQVIEHLNKFNFNIFQSKKNFEGIDDFIPTLNPLQILSVSQYFKNKKDYNHFGIVYLSQLINESHSKNHNDFTIDTGYKHYIANNLVGKHDNLIRVNVLSDTGKSFAYNASYCKIKANTNVKDIEFAKNCDFNINGNLSYLGNQANHCKISINGDLLLVEKEFYHIQPVQTTLQLNKQNYEKWEQKLTNMGYKVEVLKE